MISFIQSYSQILINKLVMGGGESKDQQILKFVEAEWELCAEHQGRNILRNIHTLKEAEVCLLPLDPIYNVPHEYEIYNYRRVQQEALVEVFAVQQLQQKEMMCGSHQTLKVLCERMVLRLDEIRDLQFADGLYVLSESIRGYYHIFQRIGFFNITASMICLNNSGQIKVWLNNNLAQNHPVDQRPLLQKTQQKNSQAALQQLMLQNLIQLVEQRCKNGRFRQDFRSRIYSKSNLMEAYSQIERYCLNNSVQVPAKLIIHPEGSFHSNPNPSLIQSINNQGINWLPTQNANNQPFKMHHSTSPTYANHRTSSITNPHTSFTPFRFKQL